MELSIAGARSAPGRVLARMPARGPDASVYVNVSGQPARTLLHGGHAWKDFARTMRGTTPCALRAAEAAGAFLFIDASFAFVRAVDEALQSCVAGILESEAMVLAGPLPACVVRLGLYGPHSADCEPIELHSVWAGLTGPVMPTRCSDDLVEAAAVIGETRSPSRHPRRWSRRRHRQRGLLHVLGANDGPGQPARKQRQVQQPCTLDAVREVIHEILERSGLAVGGVPGLARVARPGQRKQRGSGVGLMQVMRGVAWRGVAKVPPTQHSEHWRAACAVGSISGLRPSPQPACATEQDHR